MRAMLGMNDAGLCTCMGDKGQSAGKAWLVGCGPGALDHLTVRPRPMHACVHLERRDPWCFWRTGAAQKAQRLVEAPAICQPGGHQLLPILTFTVQLKAVRLIRQAEVIMYDDLGAEVSFATPDKTCLYSGDFLLDYLPYSLMFNSSL